MKSVVVIFQTITPSFEKKPKKKKTTTFRNEDFDDVRDDDDDDKDDDKDAVSKREERICARAESGVDEDIQRREKGNHARGEREFVAHD